jgi:hypothetical protein
MFFVFVMFWCLHVKSVIFLFSWLQWHLMFIKEVSSDYFGACGLWTACVVVFKGNFY